MVKSGQLPGKGHTEAEVQEEVNRSRLLGEKCVSESEQEKSSWHIYGDHLQTLTGKNLHKLLNWPPWLIHLMISRIIQAIEEIWITESSIYVTFVLKFLFLYIISLFPQPCHSGSKVLALYTRRSYCAQFCLPLMVPQLQKHDPALWKKHAQFRMTLLSGRSMLNSAAWRAVLMGILHSLPLCVHTHHLLRVTGKGLHNYALRY